MKSIPELFGAMVFNETVMKERLPRDIYKSLKKINIYKAHWILIQSVNKKFIFIYKEEQS